MTQVYRGTQITISTTQTGGDRWSARAEYAVPGNSAAEMAAPAATYATEEEAQRAALQTAVENIDRMRVAKGKF